MNVFNNLEAYCLNITITGTESRMARLATRVELTGVDDCTQIISRKILKKKHTYMAT